MVHDSIFIKCEKCKDLSLRKCCKECFNGYHKFQRLQKKDFNEQYYRLTSLKDFQRCISCVGMPIVKLCYICKKNYKTIQKRNERLAKKQAIKSSPKINADPDFSHCKGKKTKVSQSAKEVIELCDTCKEEKIFSKHCIYCKRKFWSLKKSLKKTAQVRKSSKPLPSEKTLQNYVSKLHHALPKSPGRQTEVIARFVERNPMMRKSIKKRFVSNDYEKLSICSKIYKSMKANGAKYSRNYETLNHFSHLLKNVKTYKVRKCFGVSHQVAEELIRGQIFI